MRKFIADERLPVVYNAKFREYALALVGSEARQDIAFCPWCGQALPTSLRDRFFDDMDRLGVDYPSETPPAAYRDDAWWRENAAPEQ
jgi:hypothetical protein